MPDVLIHGGRIVDPSGSTVSADVYIEGETIAAVGPDLAARGAETIDASGLLILPGLIDVHVHFNEPGRTGWEGAATGSRALAAGGGTAFIDMPLNSTPCVLTGMEVDRKRRALEASSIADFGIWGGLVPGHVDDMPGMAERGVAGFKAFMCDSGLPEFPRADEDTLRAGLAQARALGRPVAVHAETGEMIRPVRDRSAAAFLASRPLEAEVHAIRTVASIAAETGASLHIVHVSSGLGVRAAAQARSRGVDISIETCPHYLTFTDADLNELGVIAKCAPPFRPQAEREALWDAMAGGLIDIVGSDHSPAPPEMKIAGDFERSWGGIAGVQSTLATLLTAGVRDRGFPMARLTSLVAAMPARRFRMTRKGAIAPGLDADLVLVDVERTEVLAPEDLFQRHPISPYAGRRFQGVVRRTVRRGETIFLDGKITAVTRGRFLRPA